MKCKIEIKMDNAAFVDDPGELCRILSYLACDLQRIDRTEKPDRRQIVDVNGNNVGTCVVE